MTANRFLALYLDCADPQLCHVVVHGWEKDVGLNWIFRSVFERSVLAPSIQFIGYYQKIKT